MLHIFRRRRDTIVITFAACVLIAALACVFTPRQYQAKSTIQIQKSSADSLNLDSLMGASSSGAGDSLSANVDLQTQANILQSDALALRVVSDLNLEDTPHFKVSDARISATERRDKLLKIFSNHLGIHVVPGTRLIDVTYIDPDPKLAADIANHLVQGLIDFTFQTKFNATNEASHWLQNQLEDLRQQSEGLQSRLIAIQKSTGLFGIGTNDAQGKPIVISPALDRLQASTAALEQADMNRIIKGSIYEIAKTGSADLISQLSGTTVAAGAGQGVNNSLALIENLRTQEATIGAQVAKDETTFGPEYPRLKEERASLAHVHELLQTEIARIATRTKNDYEIAAKTSEGVRANSQRDRQAAEKLNDRTIEYTLLAKEANQSQTLYQDLLRRLKEAGILEGLHSSNVTIVDLARPPSKPSKPNITLYVTLGIFGGIVVAILAAFLINAIDNTIQDTTDIDALGLPTFGITPLRKNRNLGIDPHDSVYSEFVYRIKSSVLISRAASPPQVILVTSSNPQEGKSTSALHLAVSFAVSGKSVLHIEGDLRRPVLSKRLGLSESAGLSTLLTTRDTHFKPIRLDAYPNLSIIPAGPIPPLPTVLLESAQMHILLEAWRKQYDIIVIDSPPTLAVPDAEILQAHADATVLVARAGKTPRVALQRSYSTLKQHAENARHASIGVVLNAVKPNSAAHYGYYGSNGKRYSEYERQEEES
jgi:succinoglycan biosynthesis transport protein ExoP